MERKTKETITAVIIFVIGIISSIVIGLHQTGNL